MKRLAFWISLLLLLCLLLSAPAAADGQVQALFLNVGKADAALLFVDDSRFLVDTGSKDSFDQLEKALSVYQITHLDGVLISHTDKDHVGGLKKLLKSGVQVDVIYTGALHSEGSAAEHPVAKAAEKYGVTLVWLSAGDAFSIGQTRFQVLGPLAQDDEDENNNSLVVRVETPQGSLLFTGDMEASEEHDLLSAGLIESADVLKVAHHGRDDTTSRAFAFAVKPQWAVISTSSQQEPRSPSDKVIAYLQGVKANVAVTQDAQAGILVTLSECTATAETLDW